MPGTSAIGELVVKFTADIADILSNTEKVKNEVQSAVNAITQSVAGIKNAFTAVVGGFSVFEVLKHTIGDSVAAFSELEASQIRLQASLDATGNRAQTSVAKVQDFAEELARSTTFSVDATVNAAQALTKFTAVQGDTFERTLKDAADLAAITGETLPQAAEQLGRALENAYSAARLRRLGLINDAQVAYLKSLQESGLVAERQEAVLGFLEERSKGAAEAIGEHGLSAAFISLGTTLQHNLEQMGEFVAKTLNLEGAVRGVNKAIQEVTSHDQPTPTSGKGTLLLQGTSAESFSDIATTNAEEDATKSLAAADDALRISTADLVAILKEQDEAQTNLSQTVVSALLPAITQANTNANAAVKAYDEYQKKTVTAAAAQKTLVAATIASSDAAKILQNAADKAGVPLDSFIKKVAAIQGLQSSGLAFQAQLKAIQDAHSAFVANVDLEAAIRKSDYSEQLDELNFLNQAKLISEKEFLAQKDAAAAVEAQSEYDTAVAKQTDQYNLFLELQRKLASAPDPQKRIEVQSQVNAAWDKYVKLTETAVTNLGNVDKAQAKIGQDQTIYQAKVNEELAKGADEYQKMIAALDGLVQKQEVHASELGQTAADIAGINAAYEAQKLVQTDLLSLEQKYVAAVGQGNTLETALQPEQAQRYKLLIETLAKIGPEYAEAARQAAIFNETAKEAVENQTAAWKGWLDEIQTVFSNILSGGKNTFQQLKDWFRTTLVKELTDLAARQFLIPLVASVSGGEVGNKLLQGLNTSLAQNPLALLFGSTSPAATSVTGFAHATTSATDALATFAEQLRTVLTSVSVSAPQQALPTTAEDAFLSKLTSDTRDIAASTQGIITTAASSLDTSIAGLNTTVGSVSSVVTNLGTTATQASNAASAAISSATSSATTTFQEFTINADGVIQTFAAAADRIASSATSQPAFGATDPFGTIASTATQNLVTSFGNTSTNLIDTFTGDISDSTSHILADTGGFFKTTTATMTDGFKALTDSTTRTFGGLASSTLGLFGGLGNSIIGIIASIAGIGGAGGAGGGQAGGILSLLSKGNSLFSNPIGNFLSGVAGDFATSTAGAALGLSTQVGGLAGIGADAIAGTATAADVALTGAGTALTSIASFALPIAGLAFAAFSLLSNKSPSPAQGQFQVSSGTTGFEDNAYTKGPFGLNFGFNDANTQQFSGQGAQAFNQIVVGALNAFQARFSPEQSAAFATVLKNMTFQAFSGTFTTQDFVNKYGGQVLQQVITAAFQELDPALATVEAGFSGTAQEVVAFTNDLLNIHDGLKSLGNADFTKNIDAALQGADQATADKVQAFVDVTVQFGDSITGLKPKLEALDAASITAFVDALGGAKQFSSEMQFIADNFTTAAQKQEAAQKQLNTSFAQLNLTVPQTHEQFLALLNSFDLTTAAGRSLYASVAALAPLFVAVHGTADAAAKSVQTLADYFRQLSVSAGTAAIKAPSPVDAFNFGQQQYTQLRATGQFTGPLPTNEADWQTLLHSVNTTTEAGKHLHDVLEEIHGSFLSVTSSVSQTLHDFYNDSTLFTAAQQQANNNADDIAQFNTVGQALGVTISGNAQQFRDLVTQSIALYGKDSDQVALLLSLLPAIDNYNQGLKDQEQILQDALSNINDQLNAFGSTVTSLGTLASQSKDFATQLSDAVLLYGDQVDKLNKKIAAAEAKPTAINQSQLTYVFEPELATASKELHNAQIELSRFNDLTAQFGADKAQQLLQLQDSYAKERSLYAGNNAALSILKDNFTAQWNAIITGTAGAGSSTANALDSILKNIRTFLDGLQTGNLSPLTPLQKLSAAQATYNAQLALAQAGNQDALSNITNVAQDYLTQARDVYASSSAYTSIFGSVTGALGALATAGAGASSAAASAASAAGAPASTAIDALNSLADGSTSLGGSLNDSTTTLRRGTAGAVASLGTMSTAVTSLSDTTTSAATRMQDATTTISKALTGLDASATTTSTNLRATTANITQTAIQQTAGSGAQTAAAGVAATAQIRTGLAEVQKDALASTTTLNGATSALTNTASAFAVQSTAATANLATLAASAVTSTAATTTTLRRAVDSVVGSLGTATSGASSLASVTTAVGTAVNNATADLVSSVSTFDDVAVTGSVLKSVTSGFAATTEQATSAVKVLDSATAAVGGVTQALTTVADTASNASAAIGVTSSTTKALATSVGSVLGNLNTASAVATTASSTIAASLNDAAKVAAVAAGSTAVGVTDAVAASLQGTQGQLASLVAANATQTLLGVSNALDTFTNTASNQATALASTAAATNSAVRSLDATGTATSLAQLQATLATGAAQTNVDATLFGGSLRTLVGAIATPPDVGPTATALTALASAFVTPIANTAGLNTELTALGTQVAATALGADAAVTRIGNAVANIATIPPAKAPAVIDTAALTAVVASSATASLGTAAVQVAQAAQSLGTSLAPAVGASVAGIANAVNAIESLPTTSPVAVAAFGSAMQSLAPTLGVATASLRSGTVAGAESLRALYASVLNFAIATAGATGTVDAAAIGIDGQLGELNRSITAAGTGAGSAAAGALRQVAALIAGSSSTTAAAISGAATATTDAMRAAAATLNTAPGTVSAPITATATALAAAIGTLSRLPSAVPALDVTAIGKALAAGSANAVVPAATAVTSAIASLGSSLASTVAPATTAAVGNVTAALTDALRASAPVVSSAASTAFSGGVRDAATSVATLSASVASSLTPVTTTAANAALAFTATEAALSRLGAAATASASRSSGATATTDALTVAIAALQNVAARLSASATETNNTATEALDAAAAKQGALRTAYAASIGTASAGIDSVTRSADGLASVLAALETSARTSAGGLAGASNGVTNTATGISAATAALRTSVANTTSEISSLASASVRASSSTASLNVAIVNAPVALATAASKATGAALKDAVTGASDNLGSGLAAVATRLSAAITTLNALPSTASDATTAVGNSLLRLQQTVQAGGVQTSAAVSDQLDVLRSRLSAQGAPTTGPILEAASSLGRVLATAAPAVTAGTVAIGGALASLTSVLAATAPSVGSVTASVGNAVVDAFNALPVPKPTAIDTAALQTNLLTEASRRLTTAGGAIGSVLAATLSSSLATTVPAITNTTAAITSVVQALANLPTTKPAAVVSIGDAVSSLQSILSTTAPSTGTAASSLRAAVKDMFDALPTHVASDIGSSATVIGDAASRLRASLSGTASNITASVATVGSAVVTLSDLLSTQVAPKTNAAVTTINESALQLNDLVANSAASRDRLLANAVSATGNPNAPVSSLRTAAAGANETLAGQQAALAARQAPPLSQQDLFAVRDALTLKLGQVSTVLGDLLIKVAQSHRQDAEKITDSQVYAADRVVAGQRRGAK